MKRTILLATICLVLAGCQSAATNDRLSKMNVYVGDIQCQDHLAARIFKDGLSGEFLRQGIQVCVDESRKEFSTIIITGDVFLGTRTKVEGLSSWNPGKTSSAVGVESASLRATTMDGKLVAIVTQDRPGVTIQNAARDMSKRMAKKLR